MSRRNALDESARPRPRGEAKGPRSGVPTSRRQSSGIRGQDRCPALPPSPPGRRDSAPHFSTWNCDQPLPTHGCVTGSINTADGQDRSGATIRAVGITYISTTTARTNQNGDFCLEVKNGEQVWLEISYSVGGQMATTPIQRNPFVGRPEASRRPAMVQSVTAMAMPMPRTMSQGQPSVTSSGRGR